HGPPARGRNHHPWRDGAVGSGCYARRQRSARSQFVRGPARGGAEGGHRDLERCVRGSPVPTRLGDETDDHVGIGLSAGQSRRRTGSGALGLDLASCLASFQPWRTSLPALRRSSRAFSAARLVSCDSWYATRPASRDADVRWPESSRLQPANASAIKTTMTAEHFRMASPARNLASKWPLDAAVRRALPGERGDERR